MPKMGKMSTAELKRLQTQLAKIQKSDMDAFVESCAKELAARLLAKVIKRTPVGVYPKSTGKKGGTLRRGWTAKTHEDAQSGKDGGSAAKSWANSLTINRKGNVLQIEIVNPVEYASYVEYGHRKGKNGWAEGKFMLTISEQEIQNISPRLLEAKITQFLKGAVQ